MDDNIAAVALSHGKEKLPDYLPRGCICWKCKFAKTNVMKLAEDLYLSWCNYCLMKDAVGTADFLLYFNP